MDSSNYQSVLAQGPVTESIAKRPRFVFCVQRRHLREYICRGHQGQRKRPAGQTPGRARGVGLQHADCFRGSQFGRHHSEAGKSLQQSRE